MLNRSWRVVIRERRKKTEERLQASGRKREERAGWVRAQQHVFCMQEERQREIEEQWERYRGDIREDLTRIEQPLDRRRTGWDSIAGGEWDIGQVNQLARGRGRQEKGEFRKWRVWYDWRGLKEGWLKVCCRVDRKQRRTGLMKNYVSSSRGKSPEWLWLAPGRGHYWDLHMAGQASRRLTIKNEDRVERLKKSR